MAGGGSTLDPKESNLVQSLLSPLGTHPSPVGGAAGIGSPSNKPMVHLSPADFVSMARKCSLIHEESHEEEDDDFDMDPVIELKPSKSLELLDERVSDMSPCTSKELGISPKESSSSMTHEPCSSSATSSTSSSSVNPRRPLKSVCSSPQLLNQIHEENESEDDDDFVPLKLSAPRGRYSHHHTGLASPEIMRKYEQRRRRGGTGSRGTSCSSSDASDTDDTDGRSRKDKLKHKFVHRRDSSDHSSDTDGPSGSNSNGGGGGGGRISGGSGAKTASSRGGNNRGGNGGGGGGGSSGGSGDKGGKCHNHHSNHHSRPQNHHNSLNNKLNRCSSNNSSSFIQRDDSEVVGGKGPCLDFHHRSLSSEDNDMVSPDLAEDFGNCGQEEKNCFSLPSLQKDDDKANIDQEDHSFASHWRSIDNVDLRNSLNNLFLKCNSNNNNSKQMNHHHRRNHLSRQKQVICTKDEDEEEEEECDFSGTIATGDISENDIGIVLPNSEDCCSGQDGLSIDLIASAMEYQRVGPENDESLCSSSIEDDTGIYGVGSNVHIDCNDGNDINDNQNPHSTIIAVEAQSATIENTSSSSPAINNNNNSNNHINNGSNVINSSNNNNNNNTTTTTDTSSDTTSNTMNGISEYLNNVVLGTTTSPSLSFYDPEEGRGVQFVDYDYNKSSHGSCNHLLQEGANPHVVDCQGSHLTLKCQLCAMTAANNNNNNNNMSNNNNNNNSYLHSPYCNPGPGSVMVQLESKCCSVV